MTGVHDASQLATRLPPADLFLFFEEASEATAASIREFFLEHIRNNRASGWLVCGLLDYYIHGGSSRCLDVIVSCSLPNAKHLIDRLYEMLSCQQFRARALAVCGYCVRGGALWLHQLASHVSTIKLICGIVQSDVDLHCRISGTLLLTQLLPMFPRIMAGYLNVLFDTLSSGLRYLSCVRERCVTSPVNGDTRHVCAPVTASLSPAIFSQFAPLQRHLYWATYSLLVRLYVLYPCNLFSHLRKQYAVSSGSDGGAAAPQRSTVVLNMLQQLRLSPLLVLGSSEAEFDPRRWQQLETHDIVHECMMHALLNTHSSISCQQCSHPEQTTQSHGDSLLLNDSCFFPAVEADCNCCFSPAELQQLVYTSPAEVLNHTACSTLLHDSSIRSCSSKCAPVSLLSSPVSSEITKSQSTSVPNSPRKRFNNFRFLTESSAMANSIALSNRLSEAVLERSRSNAERDRRLDVPAGSGEVSETSSGAARRRMTADSALHSMRSRRFRHSSPTTFSPAADQSQERQLELREQTAAYSALSESAVQTPSSEIAPGVSLPIAVPGGHAATGGDGEGCSVTCSLSSVPPTSGDAASSPSVELGVSAGATIASSLPHAPPASRSPLHRLDSTGDEDDEDQEEEHSRFWLHSSSAGEADLVVPACQPEKVEFARDSDDFLSSSVHFPRASSSMPTNTASSQLTAISSRQMSLYDRHCSLLSATSKRRAAGLVDRSVTRCRSCPSLIVRDCRLAPSVGVFGKLSQVVERADACSQTDDLQCVSPYQHLIAALQNQCGVKSSVLSCNPPVPCSFDCSGPQPCQQLMFERHQREVYERRCRRMFDRVRHIHRLENVNKHLNSQVSALSVEVAECQRQLQLTGQRHERQRQENLSSMAQLRAAADSGASRGHQLSCQLHQRQLHVEQLEKQLIQAQNRLQLVKSQLLERDRDCVDNQQLRNTSERLKVNCDHLERQLLMVLSDMNSSTRTAGNHEHTETADKIHPEEKTAVLQTQHDEAGKVHSEVVAELRQKLRARDGQLAEGAATLSEVRAQCVSRVKMMEQRYALVKERVLFLERQLLLQSAQSNSSGAVDSGCHGDAEVEKVLADCGDSGSLPVSRSNGSVAARVPPSEAGVDGSGDGFTGSRYTSVILDESGIDFDPRQLMDSGD